MTLLELTAPYKRRISENLRKSLDLQDWISDHPDLHPDERAAQYALIDALERQNEQVQQQWDEAREQWLRTRTGRMQPIAEALEEIKKEIL